MQKTSKVEFEIIILELPKNFTELNYTDVSDQR